MKDTVAERVLASVMEWDAAEVAEFGPALQALAAHKYDSYEGYRPGVKFLEHLTGWLYQFPTVEERQQAIRFVLDDLIFISGAELGHLIETVYPDHIRPMLIKKTSERLGVSRFAVAEIVRSDLFRHLQRATLVLGLSDGAHIDQLRRTSPELSHEQIFLATDIGDETMVRAVRKLREATCDPDARFEQVLLVDDFYGSGRTLLRKEDGEFNGRLWRTRERLAQLAEGVEDSEGGIVPALAPGFSVSVLVYIAAAQAEEHVRGALLDADIDWQLSVVQPLPADVRITHAELRKMCEEHYDPILTDKHKQRDVPFGFSDCALPLVLQHNTPNNSICILWADSTEKPDSLERRALFPRYERHQEGRN